MLSLATFKSVSRWWEPESLRGSESLQSQFPSLCDDHHTQLTPWWSEDLSWEGSRDRGGWHSYPGSHSPATPWTPPCGSRTCCPLPAPSQPGSLKHCHDVSDDLGLMSDVTLKAEFPPGPADQAGADQHDEAEGQDTRPRDGRGQGHRGWDTGYY